MLIWCLVSQTCLHTSMPFFFFMATMHAEAKGRQSLCVLIICPTGMAIISLVGRQLKSMVGISGRFFSTLGDHGINIEMISQGASEINISCVIEEREANRALNVVHTNLFTVLE